MLVPGSPRGRQSRRDGWVPSGSRSAVSSGRNKFTAACWLFRGVYELDNISSVDVPAPEPVPLNGALLQMASAKNHRRCLPPSFRLARFSKKAEGNVVDVGPALVMMCLGSLR